VRTRVRFIDRVFVELDNPGMSQLYHPLDLFDSLEFVSFVGDIDDFHGDVGSKPYTFVYDAETALSEFISR